MPALNGKFYLSFKLMIMYITDTKTLREVKMEFQDKFPFLKIEFYRGTHAEGQGSLEKDHLDETMTIGQARKIHKDGEMGIHGNLKVSSLEQTFQEDYGLNVQVFRRSGELWLQTTSTDEWTLSEQNEKGGKSGSTGQYATGDNYEVD